MRTNVKNKKQLNILVEASIKKMITEGSLKMGCKPNEFVEKAITRLHHDIVYFNGEMDNCIEILKRIEVKVDALYDES